MKAHLYQLWDKLSLYLPIALMAFFAIGTWWLVRNTPKLDEGGSVHPVRHESDYQLQQFSIQSFDAQGHFKSQLWGEQALHYPDTDTLEIKQVRLHGLDLHGATTRGSALRALVSANSTQVELTGQVHLVHQPAPAANATAAMTFDSEALHIDTERDELHTATPVVIAQGGKRFSANGMTYQHEQGQLELRGQVRSTLTPQRHPG